MQKGTDEVVICGSGLWTPDHVVTNEELVESLNAWAGRYNERHRDKIRSGVLEAAMTSDPDFIVRASGIRQRHVYVKDGILDIDCMRPRIPERGENEISHQAGIALEAARDAMQSAGKSAKDIDAVIVSCAYTQRAYPAIAIEVQNALGINGFAFDMLVACSSATFALHRAWEMVRTGSAGAVLVINPELVSPQVNYRDRDSHFIFGDVATAVIVGRADRAAGKQVFHILGTSAETSYSNNIRSNFGYMSHAFDDDPFAPDKLFHQKGREVFRDVCPMVVKHMTGHLSQYDLEPSGMARWWLHQANINMNQRISRSLLGRVPGAGEAPIVLDRYGNTASAGSIIAFHLHHDDLQSGDHGVICSFGAGYSIGRLVVRKQ